VPLHPPISRGAPCDRRGRRGLRYRRCRYDCLPTGAAELRAGADSRSAFIAKHGFSSLHTKIRQQPREGSRAPRPVRHAPSANSPLIPSAPALCGAVK
jgi:hypothetical protein